MTSHVLALIAVVLAASSFACSEHFAADDASTDPIGRVEIALSIVPADVGCIRLTATGATRIVEHHVAPAGHVAAGGLPTGDVIVAAEAHAESCDVFDSNARATWVASPVVTTLTTATPTQIDLLFFRVL